MSQEEIDAITESGGPKPQFAGNEVLTATNLNLATRHWVTTEVPGDHLGNDGDIAFVAGDSAPNSQLPGLGGWATIEEVDGTYEKHTYGDWVVYEWTDNGTMQTDGSGFVQTLLVGSGGSGIHSGSYALGGGGGGVLNGTVYLDGTDHEITVGSITRNGAINSSGYPTRVDQYAAMGGAANNTPGGSTGGDQASRGTVQSRHTPGQGHAGFAPTAGNTNAGGGGAGGAGTQTEGGPGVFIDYTGKGEVEYGKGGGATWSNVAPTLPGQGSNGYNSSTPPPGADGVAFIRVPAANAQNVTENFFRWISYATVENGVVTKVTKTPDNQPYTASADEVECDASVQEGYLYENGEFTAPEPDYSEEIEALTARLEELRNV